MSFKVRRRIELTGRPNLFEQQLFLSTAPQVVSSRFVPYFHDVHKELRSRKRVTLNLFWQEYKEQHPDGYQYSW
jgi:hypothetical protein